MVCVAQVRTCRKIRALKPVLFDMILLQNC